jgi:hypothetical protein
VGPRIRVMVRVCVELLLSFQLTVRFTVIVRVMPRLRFSVSVWVRSKSRVMVRFRGRVCLVLRLG